MAAGEKIIGIDLGTTNSVVAVMEGKDAKVIPNAEGNRLTPSVVAFTDKGEVLVGEPARRQAVTNPTKTVYSIKRFMGRRHSEVATEEKMVPYEVIGGAEDYVKVKVGDKQFTPPEVSAKILVKLKEAAEAYLGHKVNKAVITVPAYLMTRSGRRPRTPAKSRGWKFLASSMSRRPRRWPMVSTKRVRSRFASSTSVAVRLTYRSWKSRMACSASFRRTAIRIWAATISMRS
jgi:hypothetical protein